MHTEVARNSLDLDRETISPSLECVAQIRTAENTSSATIPVVRNHSGLSYLRIEAGGDGIQSVELGWEFPAALLRLDLLLLSSPSRTGEGPGETCLSAERFLDKLEATVENDSGSGIFLISASSRITIPVDRLLPEQAHWTRLEVGYLVLEVLGNQAEAGELRVVGALGELARLPQSHLDRYQPDNKEVVYVEGDEAAEACQLLQDELVALRRSWS